MDSQKWQELQDKNTKVTNLMFELITLTDIYNVTFEELIRTAHRTAGAVHHRANTPVGRCRDCDDEIAGSDYGNVWEYYNVHDDIWAESGLGPNDGYLCIGCLEKRIGRELKADDFGNCQINTHPLYTRSPRFQERLDRR